jgi:hypothetical protein
MKKLKANFDVLPHGIKTVNGEPYAIFKMIVGIEVEENEEKDSEKMIDDFYQKWVQLTNYIDKKEWFYKLEKNQLLVNTNEIIGYSKLMFNIISLKGKEVESRSFQFGKRKKEKKYKDSFKSFKNENLQFGFPPPTKEEAFITQFETSKESVVKINSDNRNIYSENLKNANKHANQTKLITDKSNNEFDLKVVYSSLLDAPLAAEVEFGIIREFRIKVSEFEKFGDDFTYKIQIENEEESLAYYRFIKKSINSQWKYYNGLKKIFFEKNRSKDDIKDFENVRAEFADPYKMQLEGKGFTIDGIYIIVKYNEKNNVIIDPFRDGPIKGFNTIVKVDKITNYSLSVHSTKYSFSSGRSIQEIGSGHLIGATEMETGKETKIRNNVLIGWRGDNLIVNRISKSMEEPEEEQSEGKGKMEVVNNYCNEDRFVKENFYEVKEKLIDSSQIQLLFGKKYTFYIRSVTPTNYYLPSKVDFKDNLDIHELTFEDFEKDLAVPIIEDIDLFNAGKLPIKAASVIGSKIYKQTSDYVDQERHLVLNKVEGEKNEHRYIYPPQIKWEEFKMLGCQTADKLIKHNEDKLGVSEFISRSIRLENKLKNKIPKIACHRTSIDYLADVRGKDLYIFPSDLFTASVMEPKKLSAYEYSNNFPFYTKTEPVLVEVRQRGKFSEIIFNGYDNKKIVYSDLSDGIFNFNLYVTDSDFENSPNSLMTYNSVPLRISILNYPEKPELPKGNYTANRNGENDATYWYFPFSVGKDSYTWKSLKYQEETETLKLQHMETERILKNHYANGGKKNELLINEYPYEMFLVKEGSLDNEGLYPYIFPGSLIIDYNISDELYNDHKETGSFFRFKLNDNEVLEARYGKSGESFLRFESKEKITEVKGGKFHLEILFNMKENHFVIIKDGINWVKLDKPLNADISIQDLEVTQKVIMYTQLTACKLKFERSSDYSFISDLKTEYSSKKKIQLFGSSVFQAYFPNSGSEFDMGKEGTIINLEIPNNSKPLPPQLESDILLMHTKDNNWNDSGSYNIKESKTESVVKLSLQQNFMIEGKNKLGIIISKNSPLAERDTDISFIGEDITKLTNNDWSTENLKDILNLEDSHQLFKKYINQTSSKFYKIGTTTYEILEFDPFYNTELKRWQIILPFKFFRGSETMFVKLVSLKITPGHGLTSDSPISPGTAKNPYIDSTGTNLSVISEPIQFPIYNRKRITIKKSTLEDRKSFIISIDSMSIHKDKIYYIMLTKQKMEWTIMNLQTPSDIDKFNSLVEFELLAGIGTKKGKVLSFTGIEPVIISMEKCHSVVILEFEIHSNSNINRVSDPEFEPKNENPLFDKKGIRLINVAEFKV